MKRTVWFMLGCLLLASLMLASCGPAAEEKEEEVAPAAGGPQYGGTLRIFRVGLQQEDPPSPDIALGAWAPTQWLTLVQEKPFIGDFEKYGPRGSGEFSFTLNAYIPEKYLIGNLLESWETTPEKAIWKVRPGIMWQDREGVMESRELTAEDIAADLNYYRDGAAGKKFAAFTGDIYAADKYTVVIEFTRLDLSYLYMVGYEDRALVSPPEMVEAGPDKWENQVGTGPYMLKDYVIGTSMTFVKNPIWRKTTVIDGVKYKLPFIERIVMPIIPDEATQMAALRTGTLDLVSYVPSTQWSSLEEQAPQLKFIKYNGGEGLTLVLRCDTPPLDSREVRRALMIGTDLKAFADILGIGPLPIHWYPVHPADPTVYTPLDDLPPETRMLYDYDPEKAKQMLADAGYPNGFKLQFMVVGTPDEGDLLTFQWAKIGVEIEPESVDMVTWHERRDAREYKHTFLYSMATANPVDAIVRRGASFGAFNFSMWKNERFDELATKIAAELDPDERARMIKEAAIIKLDDAMSIPLRAAANAIYWWPWLKNYYGESNVTDLDVFSLMAYAWIDQDLKAEMGY